MDRPTNIAFVAYCSRENRNSSPWGGLHAGQVVYVSPNDKPPAYLIKCDGRKMVGDQHPELFSAIGYTYSPERPYIRGPQPSWWRRVFLREKAKMQPNPAYDPNVFCVPDLRGIVHNQLGDSIDPSYPLIYPN